VTIDLADHGLISPAATPADAGGPGSIAAILDGPRAEQPDATALVGRHGRYTFAELDAVASQAANALRALGVEPGDRVAATLPNDTDIVVAFLGAMRLGAVWLGINRALAGPEKTYMLSDAEVGVVLADPDMAAQLRPLSSDVPTLRNVVVVDPAASSDPWRDALGTAPTDRPEVLVDPLAPAAIAYTSGTTGFPKGAVHTQHNLLLPGTVSARRGLARPGAVLGVALPLTILNLMVLGPLVAYQTGAGVVAMDRLDGVGLAEWIQAERITTFSAVPAMVHDLLTHPAVTDDMLESLDGIGVGGADMPDAFRRLYHNRFGAHVGTGYGLTEAPTAVTVEDVTGRAPDDLTVSNTCGRALPQVEIHILDDDDQPVPVGEAGEVCVGPATSGDFADVYRPMLGYWNRPDASAEALRGGLLHTGDVGRLDAEGNLFILDRKHDLIIRGGANIYPAEVERVLHDLEGVAACAVIGVDDERLGERVVAFVDQGPDETLSEAEVRDHCAGRLARYKVPDEVRFVDGFARTPMGKIIERVLRED